MSERVRDRAVDRVSPAYLPVLPWYFANLATGATVSVLSFVHRAFYLRDTGQGVIVEQTRSMRRSGRISVGFRIRYVIIRRAINRLLLSMILARRFC